MGQRRERRNLALWAGPLVTLLGVGSYFTFFARWPGTRDFPWANLLILTLAVALSILGARRTWRQTLARRLIGLCFLGLSGVLSAFFILYCFYLSSQLPPQDGALDIGQPVPALTLVDQQGHSFDLGAAAAERLLLVFYRGHW